MNHIKRVHIEGFKKFESLDVIFNEHMNILVGENEAGKSTILEALRIVLNQHYRNADKAMLQDFFNIRQVQRFKENPCIETLPKIYIEVELDLDSIPQNTYFCGEVYKQKKEQEEKHGIAFECKYNIDLGGNMDLSKGEIPFEYYQLIWTTFARHPYQVLKRPLNIVFIDTTNGGTNPAFNYYNRTLFLSKYAEEERLSAKVKFRNELTKAFESIELPPLDANRKFEIDHKKVTLETILSVYEGDIALESKGSGMESLIKVEIALNKSSGLNVILMEEPENHLSHTTLHKMLQAIETQQNNAQMIITTHSNIIASRLKLDNVLWLAEDTVRRLKDVKPDTAAFFFRLTDNSLLQLLLSKKVFLVEGPTEFLLLPKFYEQITGHTMEADEVSIISCNGITYKRYLEVAEVVAKKVAVITDNDKKEHKIKDSQDYNKNKGKELQHIFMAETTDDWTWEVCIYKENRERVARLLKEQIKVNSSTRDSNSTNADATLEYMMGHKVQVAYEMLESQDVVFKAPKYVEEAIQWLSE